ncbi:hypothetical protein D7241_17275 [Stutzerimonas sp. VN223-3]|uniref:hypothetical protein n=1 Tax=Stutzerimonas TaxID=2901164 RepID=UPI0021091933|nr:hypothetical protein [Stutzerimonas stutzeri]MCQ4311939.1 hypothetical protein [Stutzerimonas stutzeri]
MNEQAVPVLIAFLTVAGVAAFLLRRAFTVLGRQQFKNDAGSLQVSLDSERLDDSRVENRSAP